ncbi:hypothetical protein PV10_01905 [Exophiala mesophila]|uniref:Required for respiratory growth protein 7, mitochondrial n=1 Tax=Exophiala mesophila TaxID=212818 RepID=A0A0D1ZUN1_EXOME|nr:uncharacterized protein PV10_01905 [Exophiala mesophila]KIV98237.1 hypothetical protein PV10_01905 [Exophiala mesophila]
MRIHVQVWHPTTQYPHVRSLVWRRILGWHTAQVRSSSQTTCRKNGAARFDRSNTHGPKSGQDHRVTNSRVNSTAVTGQQSCLRLLGASQKFHILAGSGCSSSNGSRTMKFVLKKRWFSWTCSSSSRAAVADATPSSLRRDSDAATAASPTSLPSSYPHHDLASFITDARRTGLSPTSTVYTGTAYEYLTLETLSRYGFELTRVGGRGDRGVDLVGYWRVPRSPDIHLRAGSSSSGETETTSITTRSSDVYRVLVQCKRLVGKHAKIGPNLIRELDGAVRGARIGRLFPSAIASPSTGRDSTLQSGLSDEVTAGDESSTDLDSHTTRDQFHVSSAALSPSTSGPVVGILVGTRPATKGVVESLRRSTRPLVWVMLEEVECSGDAASSPGGVTRQERNLEDASPRIDQAFEDGDNENRRNLDQDAPGNLLSSPAGFSAGEHASPTFRAPTPLKRGHIKQILWNQAAREAGLEGVDVVKRYRPRTLHDLENGDGCGSGNGEIEELVLTREGRVILGM